MSPIEFGKTSKDMCGSAGRQHIGFARREKFSPGLSKAQTLWSVSLPQALRPHICGALTILVALYIKWARRFSVQPAESISSACPRNSAASSMSSPRAGLFHERPFASRRQTSALSRKYVASMALSPRTLQPTSDGAEVKPRRASRRDGDHRLSGSIVTSLGVRTRVTVVPRPSDRKLYVYKGDGCGGGVVPRLR